MTKKYSILSFLCVAFVFTNFLLQSRATINKNKVLYLHEQNMRSLNESALNDFIRSGNVIIIFYEDWCGPCKRMKPIFEKLVEKIDDVLFIKVQRSLYRELFDKFKLTTIPAMLFFKKGKLVYIQKSSATKKEMMELINKHFYS